jgi:alkylated DNA repair protein (DNA oxidative demethylase)
MIATLPLFGDAAEPAGGREPLGECAAVLRGFALPYVDGIVPALAAIERAAPFRHLVTPGGQTMSVAMTNCGALGWVSDRRGYRYAAEDPQSGQPWPPMPAVFLRLARAAAAEIGFAAFMPEACLVNRYETGTRLSLHQDRDEQNYDQPIVSVSLGVPATFLFGGNARADKTVRIPLIHGDVVVWGGVDRLRFHGVLPLKPAEHPLFGTRRINLTFRKAR